MITVALLLLMMWQMATGRLEVKQPDIDLYKVDPDEHPAL
jgi:hypothetical protein